MTDVAFTLRSTAVSCTPLRSRTTGDAPRDIVGADVALGMGAPGLRLLLRLGVGDREGERLDVRDTDGLRLSLRVADALRLSLRVWLALRLSLRVWLGERVSDGVWLGERVSEGV